MVKMGLHNFEIAGLLRRLAAACYDWLLVIAVLMLLSVPFVAPTDSAIEPGQLWYQLFLLAAIWAYFVGFWVRRGQTPGMRAWRLYLDDQAGGRITVKQGTLRLIAAALSLATLGAGFLWQLIDRDKLTWHDRISATRLRYQQPDN
jgi:uncharacterized RDD family membrane protein YckC